jgi:hypothetical protein
MSKGSERERGPKRFKVVANTTKRAIEEQMSPFLNRDKLISILPWKPSKSNKVRKQKHWNIKKVT